MTGIAFEVKNQQELSIIASALQREKELLEWEIKKTKAKVEAFEKQHAMPSSEFMKKYLEGRLGDKEEVMTWAGEYQLLQKFLEKQKQLEDLIQECKKHMQP